MKCRCGYVWDSEEGEIQNDLRDDRGQLLSEEFRLNFAKYRLRCT